MTRFLAVLLAAVAAPSLAVAQVSPNDISIANFNPGAPVAPISSVEGNGIKVGEGTVLRPVFGIETGFISNVFYQQGDPQATGVLRLIAQVGVASLGAARLHPSAMVASDLPQEDQIGKLEYRADLRLAYDQMLSGDDVVNDTGGLGIGATIRGMVNPQGRFAFGFSDDYNRLIRAANFETSANTNRHINDLQLQLLYRPRDSAISGYLYYMNRLDIFERGEQDFANRMSNKLGIHPQWRFLPQTQAYLDVSIANVTAINDASTKSNSYPLVVRAGLATLLTVKTTLNIDAGYTNGFYSNGPSFSAPVVGAMLGYRYSPLGRVTLGYALQYEDSINANYYRDHIIYGTIQHLVNPLIVMIQPEVHFRQYRGIQTLLPDVMGPDTRDDTVFSVVGGVHYNFRNWMQATLNYRFAMVSTDYTYMINGFTDDPSFTRHEILAGLRVAM